MVVRIGYTQPQGGGQGTARTKKTLGVAGVALATTDVNQTTNNIALFRVPAGFTVTGLYASATDMDTGGSPTLAINIGDSGSANRFLAASNIGATGISTSTVAATGLYYTFTADTDILFACNAAAATAAAGTITVYLEGFIG